MNEQLPVSAHQGVGKADLAYALVAGLYVGVLSLAPISLLGIGVVSDGAIELGTYLFLLVVIAMPVAVVVTLLRGLPEYLGASRLIWTLVVLPVVPIASLVVADGPVVSPSVVSLVWMPLVLVGGIVFGLSLLRRSRRQHIDAVTGSMSCEWTARVPQPSRRFIRYGYRGALILNAVYWSSEAGWIPGTDWSEPISTLVLGLATLGIFLGGLLFDWHRGTYRVTSVGLVRRDFLPTISGWEAFESYDVTDDALHIRRRAWWRPDIRCALADIDDPESVDDALRNHLLRA